MMYFTDQNVCSPRYKVSISERSILFGAVLERFEGIEIPLYVWIFMHCLNIRHDDRTKISVKTLYDQMIARFDSLSSGKDISWLMPSICVINFLFFADDWTRNGFFFDLLHEIMKTCCGQKEWKFVWQLSDGEEMFERFINIKCPR